MSLLNCICLQKNVLKKSANQSNVFSQIQTRDRSFNQSQPRETSKTTADDIKSYRDSSRQPFLTCNSKQAKFIFLGDKKEGFGERWGKDGGKKTKQLLLNTESTKQQNGHENDRKEEAIGAFEKYYILYDTFKGKKRICIYKYDTDVHVSCTDSRKIVEVTENEQEQVQSNNQNKIHKTKMKVCAFLGRSGWSTLFMLAAVMTQDYSFWLSYLTQEANKIIPLYQRIFGLNESQVICWPTKYCQLS
ncbi:hypothetical protein RFI_37833 [Reticulomyxa filosa]|uniref:Uncharacterized protein n=1 Tax=Reticulomyxa filosa TaxID=46433 RepID=X6LC81_RETFI|nr:hypothetical protein RFI_37833 [Reticulomyxa filosa]|eukprot:ETN99637.1 hypothetical protein RFI_37833 [Reticulomyxa filosa]